MNKSSKVVPIFMLIGLITAAVLRFFQYVSVMDFNTGFFIEGSELAGVLIYILMAVIAVVYIVLLILGKKKGEAAYTVSSDGMGSHATQMLGASELLGAGLIASDLLGQISTLRMFCEGGIAVILLVSGFLQLKNTVPPTITGHIKIAAAILLFPVLAEIYESDLIMVRRSDKLLVILSYIFICAFFASTARFYSRLETVNSRMRELITSGIVLIITAAHVLPKLLAFAFGGTATAGMSGIDMVAAAGALMSAAFIGTLFFTEKKKDIIPVVYDEDEDKKKKDPSEPETTEE